MLLLCAVGCGNSSESSGSENTSEGSSSSSGLTIEKLYEKNSGKTDETLKEYAGKSITVEGNYNGTDGIIHEWLTIYCNPNSTLNVDSSLSKGQRAIITGTVDEGWSGSLQWILNDCSVVKK